MRSIVDAATKKALRYDSHRKQFHPHAEHTIGCKLFLTLTLGWAMSIAGPSARMTRKIATAKSTVWRRWLRKPGDGGYLADLTPEQTSR